MENIIYYAIIYSIGIILILVIVLLYNFIIQINKIRKEMVKDLIKISELNYNDLGIFRRDIYFILKEDTFSEEYKLHLIEKKVVTYLPSKNKKND